MGFNVILAPQSLANLKEIVDYIADDNPERARTFGNELIDRAQAIAKFPEIGRVVPEIRLPVVCEVIHGSYRITLYEIFHDQNAIYVLRFWHGARGEPQIRTAL